MIELRVLGSPAPQGSKRFIGLSKKTGRGIMIESSKRVKPWRESVRWAATYEMTRLKMMAQPNSIVGPVDLEITFTLPKPKSAPKRTVTYPSKYPDLSKLVRSTEDSLSEVGIWEDDARIVRCVSMKFYPGQHPDALDVPGAVIRIRPIADTVYGKR